MQKGKYGKMTWTGGDGHQHSRKLTSTEREEVLANYIRRRSGRKFVVRAMAELLGCCERTIQNHLAVLQAKGWIERKACHDEIGRQTGNVIVYSGPKKRLTGEELTLEKITGTKAKD